jgi:hypothetical protein
MIYLPCQFEIHQVYLGRSYENTDFNPWHEISCPLNSSNTHVKKRRAIQTWAYVKSYSGHVQLPDRTCSFCSHCVRSRVASRKLEEIASGPARFCAPTLSQPSIHGFNWNFRESQPFYINTSSFFMELELPRCHDMTGRMHWTSKVVPQNLRQFNSWITVTMNYNSQVQVGWITIAMNNHCWDNCHNCRVYGEITWNNRSWMVHQLTKQTSADCGQHQLSTDHLFGKEHSLATSRCSKVFQGRVYVFRSRLD